MIDSGVMTVFIYKELTRNLCVFPNIWRLGPVRDTKFGTNVSAKKYTAKCQCYSFYHFSVVKGKPTDGGVKLKIKDLN